MEQSWPVLPRFIRTKNQRTTGTCGVPQRWRSLASSSATGCMDRRDARTGCGDRGSQCLQSTAAFGGWPPSHTHTHTLLCRRNRHRAGRITHPGPGCTPGSDHGSCCRSRGCSSRTSPARCRHPSGRVWANGRNQVWSPATGVASGSVGLVRSGEPPRLLFSEHVPNARACCLGS